jgi:ubiquinone/menaquinone biosynthesis C-methylase UbiE
MMNSKNLPLVPFESISAQILKRSIQITGKDGSQGLDAITSLHQYHRAYAAVVQNIKPGAKVLDWGGGAGHFSYFLAKEGYSTTIFAFDQPDFVMPEIKQGQVQFVLADANEPKKLPFEDESFDAVCSIGVLEHVRETGGDEKASLAEIRRILRPNGVFICYHFPNKTSWIEFLARRIGIYHHQFTYERSEIEAIFKPALSIQLCKRYALLPRNFLRRLPPFITNHSLFAKLFDAIDVIISPCLPWFNQNWMVVARKSSHRSSANS